MKIIIPFVLIAIQSMSFCFARGVEANFHSPLNISSSSGYDLALTKVESSSGPYAVGSNVSFTITITNEGCEDAFDIQVQDNPDFGFNYLGSDAMSNPNVVEPVLGGFIISSIPQGQSETIEVDFMIDMTYQGTTIANRAQILVDDGDDIDSDPMQDYFDDDDGDGNPIDDDESVVVIDIVPTYDLALTKITTTFGTIEPGDVVSFTIVVFNQGQANASDIQVTDFSDVGLNYQGFNASSNVTYLGNQQFEIASLTPGQSQSITLMFQIDPTYQGATIENQAEITVDDGDDIDSTPANGILSEDDRDNVILNVTISCNLQCTIDGTDLSCYFSDDGMATVTATGGATPYEYIWSTGETTQTINNLLPTVYTVTVTDDAGCVTSCVVALNEPFELLCSMMTFDATNGSNGALSVSASGGTTPYLYSIDNVNFQSSPSFMGLSPGTYTVLVRDDNGCETTCTGTINGSGPSLTCSATSTDETDCGAMDGTITNTGTGGTMPYSYSLNGSNYSNTSGVFTGLSSGTYNVFIQDANGTVSTCSTALSAPSTPGCSISGTQISCVGANDGTITALGTGGSGNYEYSLNGGSFQSSGFFNNLSTGNYVVTVRNVGTTACTSTCNFMIVNPAVFTCSVNKLNDVICHSENNGAAQVQTSGGTAPYVYSWSTGATTQTVSNLLAGFHSVTVTDDDGCVTACNVTINQPSPLTCSITMTENECNSDGTGQLTVSSNGGTGTKEYSLNGGPYQLGFVFSNLSAGSYVISVKDANDCISTCNATIQNITLTCSTSGMDVSCFNGNDGMASVTPIGGSGPYTFAWSNTGSSTTQSVNNLTTGNYTVTVTEVSGCTAVCSVSIGQPSQLSCSLSTTDAGCSGSNSGSISVSATGGTPNYTYSINGVNFQSSSQFNGLSVGNYMIIVRDSNDCITTCSGVVGSTAGLTCSASGQNISCFGDSDGSLTVSVSGGQSPFSYSLNGGSSQTNPTFSNLAAGSYTITAEDANSCTTTCMVTISSPSALTCSVTAFPATCSLDDGSLVVSASGGVTSYEYSLNGVNFQSSPTFSGLAEGTYTLTVRDANDCTTTCTTTITSPPVPSCTTSSTPTTCGMTNGVLTVNATGGSGGYIYSINGVNFQNSNVFSNLSAGSYSVTLTDSNNCSSTCTGFIQGSSNISCSLTLNSTTCGEDDGSLTVTVSGGQAPYSYSLDGVNFQNSATFSNLSAGLYTVIVEGANGCSNSCAGTIAGSSAISCSTNVSDVTACGQTNGSITVNASGGSSPYTYSLDGITYNNTTGVFSGLGAGTYNTYVQDQDGCIAVCQGTITAPSVPSCSATAFPITCTGATDGSISVVGTGGSGSYQYSIDGVNFQSIGLFNNLAAGSYIVTIRNAGNATCTSTCIATVTDPGSIVCSITKLNNVLCNGQSNGAATVDTDGGSSPYTYTWSNGATGAFLDNLSVGTYNVTVIDSNGCTNDCSVIVEEPNPFSCTTSAEDVSCITGDLGSITVAALGGTAPYLYSIDSGTYQSGNMFANLEAGTYTIDVVDANGCTTSCAGTIAGSSAISCSTNVSDITNCGQTNGSITVNVSGGSSPYTYSLDGITYNNTTGVFSGLGAGTYNTYAQDQDGCIAVCQGTITAPSVPSCSATAFPITCTGATDGSITVVGTGGSGSYQYSINGVNFQSVGTFNNLAAGNYTITIRNTGNATCTSTCTATVTDPGSIVCSITKLNDVLCNGQSNGAATVDTEGGSSPYTYTWSNGATGFLLDNLSVGTYIVTVVDSNGCTDDCSVTIQQPNPFSCTTSAQDVNCLTGNLGSVTVTASGGTSPFLYRINNGSYQPGNMFANLVAGTYNVDVVDANGCTTSCNAIVSSFNFSCTISAMDVSCAGSNDGMATVLPNGGNSPFSYSWNDVNSSNTQTISNMAPGNYSVTVMDNSGCVTACSVSISQPTVLSCSTTASDATNGNNGTITVNANGGTPGYSYTIDGSNYQGSNVFTGLAPGSYTITVRDANFCESMCFATVVGAGQMSCTTNATDQSDCGVMDGTITVSASGGSGGYSYSLDNIDFSNTSGVFTGLNSGTYTVYAQDNNGGSTTCVAVIDSQSSPGCTISGTPITCNGAADGTITIQGTGGSGNYEYSINGISFQSSGIFTNLGPGSYGVLVRNVGTQNCLSVCNYSLTNPPGMGCAVLKNNDVLCNGESTGSAMALISGGVSPYTYLWSNGVNMATASNLEAGNHQVSITDAVGCQVVCSVNIIEPTQLSCSITTTGMDCGSGSLGSITVNGSGGTSPFMYSIDGVNFQPGNMFANLSAGNYTVTILDDNGCTSTCNATIVGGTFTCTVSSTNVSCNGGNDAMASVTSNGGNSPYTYNWSNGSNSQSVSGLSAGNYTVTVIDNDGCQSVCNTLITQPLALNCSLSKNDVSCSGSSDGAIMVMGTGGTAPYTYSLDGVTFQSNPIFSGLVTGVYTVTIMDLNSCTSTCTITINELPVVSCSASAVPESDCGAMDGEITVSGSGGSGSYTYSIDGTTYISSGTFTGLSSGTYNVIVQDSNNCSSTCSATINSPSSPGCIISGTDETCVGADDGTISVQGTGGTGNYEFSIDGVNFQPSGLFTNLAPNTYSITVRSTGTTDCTSNCTYTVLEALALNCMINLNSGIQCAGDNSGSITAAAIGGAGPYNYSWTDGNTSPSRSNIAPGTYSVTVTDAESCQTACSISVTEPLALSCTLTVSEGNCGTGSQGSIIVAGNGGTGAYQYALDGGAYQTGNVFENLAAGTYTVSIQDANGCISMCSATIMSMNFSCSVNGFNVSCNNGSDGSATVIPNGGVSPYTYAWSNGQSNQSATNLTSGIYTVTITDSNACMTDCNITILEPTALTCSLAKTDVSCAGGSDGSISVAASGGQGGYQYSLDGVIFQNSTLFTNLSFGIYTVTVRDAVDCISTCTITIFNGPQVTCSATATNATGCGIADGTITVTASGGSGPYVYSIDGVNFNNTTGVFNNLNSGLYFVYTQDSNGCSTDCSATVTSVSSPSCSVSGTNPTCFGASDGVIIITGSGGSGSYEYSIDGVNFQTSGTFVGLSMGSYSLTVRNQGTTTCTSTCNYLLTEPDELICSVQLNSNITCNNENNGSATALASGGLGSYTYLWDDGSMTATATALSGGNHTVTVLDGNGCDAICNVNIFEPGPIVCSLSEINVSCAGGSDGAISVGAFGGNGFFDYSIDGVNFQPGTLFSGLSTGNYTITVRDAQGCTTQCTTTIEDGAVLVCTTTVEDESGCDAADGVITVNTVGGSGTFMYGLDGVNYPNSTGVFANLSAGAYTIYGVDTNGCMTSCMAIIEEGSSPTCSASGSGVSCFGAMDGSISAFGLGGSGNYEYSIDGINFQASGLFENLDGGNYTITVRNLGQPSCTSTCSVIISEPTEITCSIGISSDIQCFGDSNGAVAVSVIGGLAPYSYSWSNGAMTSNLTGLVSGQYFVTVTDLLGCESFCNISLASPDALSCSIVANNETDCGTQNGSLVVSGIGGTGILAYSLDDIDYTNVNGVFGGLTSGTYTVFVQDELGCKSSCIGTITSPNSPSCSVSGTPVSCDGSNDGTITAVGSGGSGDYVYSIDGTNFQASGFFDNLSPGTYSIIVRNAGSTSCQSVCNYILSGGGSLDCGLDAQDVECNGTDSGSISATPTGGLAPYTYIWSNGATANAIANLTSGTYSVTISDNNACTIVCSQELAEPSAVVCVAVPSNETDCGLADGSIQITATGGVGGYTYSLDGIDFTNVSGQFTGLGSGTYVVYVQDSSGCQSTCDATVTSPSSPQCTAVSTDVDCSGLSNGSIQVTATEGSGSYEFSIDGSSFQSSGLFTGLTAGAYTITVRNEGSTACISTCMAVVSEGMSLSCDTEVNNDIICFGELSGSATANPTGGTPPYDYLWSNGNTLQTVANLPQGMSSVTITDDNGCQQICSVFIDEPLELTCTATATNESDCDANDGVITIVSSGGSGNTWFSLDNIDYSNTIGFFDGLSAGTYTLYVKDENDCVSTCSATLEEQETPTCSVSGTAIACNGDLTGTISVIPSGNPNDFEYSLDGTNYQSNSFFSNLGAGIYTITIRTIGSLTCLSTCTFEMTEPTLLVSSSVVENNVSCFGGSDGSATVTASGGVPPYLYNWDNGEIVATATNLSAGSHTVTVTDSNDCSVVSTVDLGEPQALSCVTNVIEIDCETLSPGVIIVTGTGGTGIYQYTIDGSNYQGANAFQNLASGTYQITIKDENDCTSICSATIAESDCIYDLALFKSETSTGPYMPGSTIVYSISVVNEGDVDASLVQFEDTPVTGLTYISSNAASLSNTDEISPMIFEISSLPINTTEVVELTFEVDLDYTGVSLINNAQIISDDGDDVDSNPDTDSSVDEDNNGSGDDDDEDSITLPIATFEIGNFVWKDLNADGMQDPGEPGVEGVTIMLFDCDGTALDVQVSDANGQYGFSNLPLSNYEIGVDISSIDPGCTFTEKDMGGDDTDDSDVNSEGLSGCFVLDPNQTDIHDIGLIAYASVGSLVWIDEDGNGLYDSNEMTLNGVMVELIDAQDNVVASTFTDADGTYLFSQVIPGDYYLRFILPAGYEFTFPLSGDSSIDSDVDGSNGVGTSQIFTLVSGQASLDLFAGVYQCVTIGDLVWLDSQQNGTYDATESGINGVKIEFYRLDEVSNSYALYDFVFTEYNAIEDQDGYWKTCVPPGTYYFVVKDNDMGLLPVSQNIGDNELIDSDININGQTGLYILSSGEEVCDIGAGYYQPSQIGDRVWYDDDNDGIQDADEIGAEGIPISLYDNTSTMIDSTITNAAGNYVFDSLLIGSYYIHLFPPSGYVPTLSNATSDDLDSDIDNVNGMNTSSLYAIAANEVIDHLDVGIVMADVLSTSWLTVNGYRSGADNIVNWTMTQDLDIDKYEIQKMDDSGTFVTIGEVVADQSDDAIKYSYVDADIVDFGSHYYRLQANSTGGVVELSKVVVIDVTLDFNPAKASVYPNPTTNIINLNITTTDVTSNVSVSVLNDLGSVVIDNKVLGNEVEFGDHNYTISLEALDRGIYFVELTIGGHKLTRRIVLID